MNGKILKKKEKKVTRKFVFSVCKAVDVKVQEYNFPSCYLRTIYFRKTLRVISSVFYNIKSFVTLRVGVSVIYKKLQSRVSSEEYILRLPWYASYIDK